MQDPEHSRAEEEVDPCVNEDAKQDRQDQVAGFGGRLRPG